MLQQSDSDLRKNLMMFDVGPKTMRRPQPMYRTLREMSAAAREHGDVLRKNGSGVVVCTRSDVDEVLRHPEVFSSKMPGDYLKNTRPLIP